MASLSRLMGPLVIYLLFFGLRAMKQKNSKQDQGNRLGPKTRGSGKASSISSKEMDPLRSSIGRKEGKKTGERLAKLKKKEVQVLEKQVKEIEKDSTKQHVLDLLEREKELSIDRKGDLENEDHGSEPGLGPMGPLLDEELVQGIIFSEIIGKPKSLRREE